MVLQRGDQVPHFELTDVGGTRVRYQTMWQRRNLVLVSLPTEASAALDAYVASLTARLPELATHEADVVVTREPVTGLQPPGLLIADRWGEVVYASSAREVSELPDADDVVDWLVYVQTRCPECEGEAR